MKNLKSWILSLAIMFTAGGALFALATPQITAAATVNCEATFLGINSWHRNLKKDVDCSIISPESKDMTGFIWTIVLNIIEMGLMLAGYAAAAFILYGGIQYILSQGAPESAVKARTTILNAVIGLVLSMMSASIVGFIVTKILPETFLNNEVTDLKVWSGVLSIVYMVSGAFAVFIIVISGYMYATAAGDAGKIAKAKNAITYAVIGVVVVLIAFAITQFVIGKMTPSP